MVKLKGLGFDYEFTVSEETTTCGKALRHNIL